MGGGVTLVGGFEVGGLSQSLVGLGEQVERGGRGRGAAQHGVDVARDTGHDEPPVVVWRSVG